MSNTPATDRSEHDRSLGASRPVGGGSFRDRVRRKPGLGQLWRVGIFLLGLVCIAAGMALVVLPGPLTIPPIVLGLWIWSTEFEWAHRLFARGKEKAQEAWAHAKRHPVSSTAVTLGGLVGAAVLIWATLHYDLVERGRELAGLS